MDILTAFFFSPFLPKHLFIPQVFVDAVILIEAFVLTWILVVISAWYLVSLQNLGQECKMQDRYANFYFFCSFEQVNVHVCLALPRFNTSTDLICPDQSNAIALTISLSTSTNICDIMSHPLTLNRQGL